MLIEVQFIKFVIYILVTKGKINVVIICSVVLAIIIILPLVFLLKKKRDKYEVEKARKKEMRITNQRINELNEAARRGEDNHGFGAIEPSGTNRERY